MEFTTLPPSPTSPTKGEYPCGINVTNLAIRVVTLLICLCGLAGNGAVLCLLGFCIRRSSITVYIFHLAVVNFLFLLFVVPATLLFLQAAVFCSAAPFLEYLTSCFLLSKFSCNTGLYLLTAISIERCMSILCPLWHRCHRPQCLSEVLNVLLEALSIAVIASVAFLCLSLKYKHCQVSLITTNALNLFLFIPAMAISSMILLIKAKCGPQQQQLKRLDIVILLNVLFFLLFGGPLSLCSFLQQLGYTIPSSQVVFLLTCITTTINPFICFLLGRCWRPCSLRSLQLSLQRIFEEPEENAAHSSDAAMDTAFPAC